MVICLEQGADLHMAQRISLPLTVCCFSKIQIGFTFLVPAHHPGSPGQRAVKRGGGVCVNELQDVCSSSSSSSSNSSSSSSSSSGVTGYVLAVGIYGIPTKHSF